MYDTAKAQSQANKSGQYQQRNEKPNVKGVGNYRKEAAKQEINDWETGDYSNCPTPGAMQPPKLGVMHAICITEVPSSGAQAHTFRF